MKTLATVLASLLLCSSASAQFDTNIWPAWQHPRQAKEQMSQLYSAIYERVHNNSDKLWNQTRTHYPREPVWYRTTQGDVADWKRKIRMNLRSGAYGIEGGEALAPRWWVDSTIVSTSNLAAWMSTNGATASPPPLTTNGVLSICRLPADFWHYTPYRGLSGLGPFTNDITVGHPYGWPVTNAAAGTNYPSGRTNWYTTDYGIDGLFAIVTNMVYMVDIWSSHSVIFTNTTGADGFHYAASNATWAQAKSDAEAAAATNSSSSLPSRYSQGWMYSSYISGLPPYAYQPYGARFSGFPANGHIQANEPYGICGSPTNFIGTFVAFAAFTNAPDVDVWPFTPTISSNVFDSFGLGFSIGVNALTGQTVQVYTNMSTPRWSFSWDSSITWCDEPLAPRYYPDWPGTSDWHAVGFKISAVGPWFRMPVFKFK